MRRVFFLNRKEELKYVRAISTEQIIYHICLYTRDAYFLKSYFEANSIKFVSIASFNFYDKLKEGFLSDFTEFTGNLNLQNNSFYWWSLNLSNKNPITTGLCDKVFSFMCIVQMLNNAKSEDILVVTEDKDLVGQLAEYAKDIKVVNLIHKRKSIKEILKDLTPLAPVYAFLRTAYFKCLSRKYTKIPDFGQKSIKMVLTLLSFQCFSKGGYKDTYFGRFIDYLNQKHIDFLTIFIVITPAYKKVLIEMERQKISMPFVTLERFLSIKDAIICLLISLKKYFCPIKLNGKATMGGVSLRYIVKRVIRNDCKSTYFFDNLRVYFVLNNILDRFNIDRVFYPYENRSFEKMLVIAAKEKDPMPRLIGYQHASLSKRHTNFFLAPEEASITPMPDRIMAMGDETYNIMREEGNFPVFLLDKACALRQDISFDYIRDKSPIKNILVVLATGIDEYVKVIMYLNAAFGGTKGYNLLIRAHPVFPLKDALNITGKPLFDFEESRSMTLDESFRWADILFYVHSTVSIEALAKGIPVVNIRIDSILDPDPLFRFNDFKWQASGAEDAINIIRMIDTMSDDEYHSRQEIAIEYVKRYFYPVNEENMAKLLA